MALLKSAKKKLLVVIAGPTAVGKTAVSLTLANHFNAPILSFDSRQFYREMTIGTAKPDASELKKAEHYFIDSLSIHDRYTSGQFELDALQKLNELFEQNEVVIAVGGSGLYINALCYGIDEIPTSETVRLKLIERWKKEGLEKLQQEVKSVDPDFYAISDMQNPRRVIRALEVFEVSGNPYSHYRKNQAKNRDFETLWLGLNLEREALFNQINQRVDLMLQKGLPDEVRSLEPFKELKALKTVGYQEFFDYFDGKHSFERAVDLVKRNTRVFAKKQIAWFSRNSELTWYLPTDTTRMIQSIEQKIHEINF
ncbi:MAG: tRNA (adenosine(37)-N6)-dimethylallyltransferase MiaA [Bacteroidetes bacterium]|nr:tRNA (adenosine(37)-N6)-dimethylallyltransferase MiaA [Bacteroidota bacterium]